MANTSNITHFPQEDHEHDKEPILQAIENAAETAVSRILGNPRVIDNISSREKLKEVSELLRQAGRKIQLNSTDVLCKPEPLGESRDAVLLLRPLIGGDYVYMMFVNVIQGEDGLDFQLTIFRPNYSDGLATEFTKPGEPVRAEIVRQLREVCTGPGPIVLSMMICHNYFQELEEAARQMQAPAVPEYTPPTEGEDRAPAASAVSGVEDTLYSSLPAVVPV